ncbi:hypothetical protein Q668_14505 [Alcanivorax sp. PN-3]|nr:hypothetical protein Q668_14505 [Alcanivorax sp. PN-3]
MEIDINPKPVRGFVPSVLMMQRLCGKSLVAALTSWMA